MKNFFKILLIGCLLFSLGCQKQVVENLKGTKIILISEDGSPSTNILNWADREGVKMTFFISAPYFITTNEIKEIGYYPPNFPKNYSYLKWRKSTTYWTNYTISLIRNTSRAIKTGHEVASHGVGHFCGGTWTEKEWDGEFEVFEKVINSRIEAYNLTKSNFLFNTKYMKGFRSPNLSVNKAMFVSMKKHGYIYDASLVVSRYSSNSMRTNISIPNDIIEIPFYGITDNHGKFNLPIDYNFYWKDSKALDVEDKELKKKFEDDYYYSLVKYIDSSDFVNILNHGSEWNDRAYWKALERFVKYAKKNYKCKFVTYSEYLKYLKLKEYEIK